MNQRVKNSIYSILLILAVFLVWKYRNDWSQEDEGYKITGNTMGTSYSVITFGNVPETLKNSIDSLLSVFNSSVNTYDPNSELSIFNRGQNIRTDFPYLEEIMESSTEIYRKTSGIFDPSIAPLSNAWGFGPNKKIMPDSAAVDSMLSLVGMDKVSYRNDSLIHLERNTQLDFNSIAKGKGVDVISEYLLERGFKDHYVEIGGEVRVSGINILRGEAWNIGIIDPASTREDTKLFGTLSVSNISVASSGNYYNYIEENGIKYSHTLNPLSGYPTNLRILAATVLAEDCMTADGWATAFMAMGHEKAIAFLKNFEKIQGIIIYSELNGEIKYFISEPIQKDFTFTKVESNLD